MTRTQDEVSTFEWLTGAIGALIFAALLGYFVRESTRAVTPASIAVQIDSVSRAPVGYVAHFTARNVGGSSAGEIHLEAVASGGAMTSRATLPFLAPSSSKSGAFLFEQDPGPGLRARAVSYQVP